MACAVSAVLATSMAWGQAASPATPPAAPPSGAPPATGPVAPPGDAAAPAGQPAGFTSRIQKFFAPHDKDGKRIAIAEGEWAILRGQDQVDLIQPVFTLFRDVEGGNQREKILIRGATGFYDRAVHRARLEGQVTVRQEDGTELRTDALDVDILQKRLTTDGRVELRKPGLTLTGAGLEASEVLNVLALRSSVILNVRGAVGGLLREIPGARAGEGGEAAEMTMTCEGPATLARMPVPRPETGATEELRLTRGVVLTRHEPAGIMRLTGDAATFDLYHGGATAPAPAAGGAPAPARVTEVRRADLVGGVQLVDAQGLSGSAHRLVWSPAEDRLELTGDSGVRVVRGVHTLQGRQVTLDRRTGRAVCRADAQMTFVPEAGAGEGGAARAAATPWVIRCDEIAMRLTPDLKGLDAVDATGRVTITGEISAAAGGAAPARQTATGDRFVWEGTAHRGLLTGAPVTLVQGDHRMEAARVVFFPLDQRVVLQGPKRIELAAEAAAPSPAPATAPVPAPAPPGVPSAAEGGIVLTAAGDIAIAAGDGAIEVGDRAQILSPQTRLEADRLRIRLVAGGGVDRALGWGHVRLSDRASGAEVFGDHLTWDVRSQEFLVEGVPFAYILQKGGRLQGQAITISRQPDGLRCANRSGMKGRIQIDPVAGKRATQ
jgi:LPS export ABC transporter protein LptC